MSISTLAFIAAVIIPPGPGPGAPIPNPPIGAPTARQAPLFSRQNIGAQSATICFGSSEIAINLHEQNTEPMRIEFSINGGPWIAARYGKIRIPEVGDGNYELQAIAYQRNGRPYKLESRTYKRTTITRTGILPGEPSTLVTWEDITPPAPPPPPPTPTPTVTFSASPITIYSGNPSTLTWTTSNVDSTSIDQGVGVVTLNGSTAVTPTSTTTYTITGTGQYGNKSASVTVKVNPPAPPPPAPLPSPTPIDLQAGTGPTSDPLPTDVVGHTIMPVDAVDMPGFDTADRRSAAIIFGASVVQLNLHENTSPILPTQVEFSLNGGPWQATRSGRVRIPDLGDGDYQVRIVSWSQTAPSGKSMVWKPLVVRRSAVTRTGTILPGESATLIVWTVIQ